MVVASEKTFLVINVMLLMICPVAVGLLAFVAYKRDKLQLNKRSCSFTSHEDAMSFRNWCNTW